MASPSSQLVIINLPRKRTTSYFFQSRFGSFLFYGQNFTMLEETSAREFSNIIGHDLIRLTVNLHLALWSCGGVGTKGQASRQQRANSGEGDESAAPCVCHADDVIGDTWAPQQHWPPEWEQLGEPLPWAWRAAVLSLSLSHRRPVSTVWKLISRLHLCSASLFLNWWTDYKSSVVWTSALQQPTLRLFDTLDFLIDS